MIDQDLMDLLMACSGGEVASDRREQLLARLREDEAFRLAYVAEVRTLGMLKAVQSSEPRWLRLEDELGWNSRTRVPGEPIEEAIAHRLSTKRSGPRLAVPGAWLVAAAAAMVAIVAVGLATWNQGRGRPIEQATARATPAPRPSEPLAMVIKLEDVRWETSTEAKPVEGDVLGSCRLRIGAGRATLSMLSGVVVVAEGPADLELLTIDKVFCRGGRLRARAPMGAEGFIVASEGSAVVDLGTEFALNVRSDGRARGTVFQGEVEASILGPSGTSQHSEVLNESRSFEIDPKAGQIDPMSGDETFVGPSDLIAAPLRLDKGYREAVLESGPWGFWRFETMEGGVVPNEVAGGPPLLATGPVRIGGPTTGNRFAELGRDRQKQYFSLAEAWEPSNRDGYAVELWFLTEEIAHASLVSLLSPADTNHHTFLLELTSRNRLTLHKPASVRMLHRLPPAPTGGDTTFTRQYYVPYRWHHLVGQMNGDRMETYLDGEPNTPLPVKPGRTPPGQLLLGQLTTLNREGPGASRPFHGRLDEFAIYDHPLTLDEVRQHHARAGLRSTNPD